MSDSPADTLASWEDSSSVLWAASWSLVPVGALCQCGSPRRHGHLRAWNCPTCAVLIGSGYLPPDLDSRVGSDQL
jgi:hypothetical protein